MTSLNSDSLQRIQNIVNNFKRIPSYASYDIRSYLFDPMGGVYAINVTKNGNPVNLFLFYPSTDGEIHSFAVYGANLREHYNAMKSSMMAFGMTICDISIEHGNEPYVDVYLDY